MDGNREGRNVGRYLPCQAVNHRFTGVSMLHATIAVFSEHVDGGHAHE